MKSRYICPRCNKKVFTRYFDQDFQEHIDVTVGRCNREEKCGYHYTPRMFYKNKKIPKSTSSRLNRKKVLPLKTYYFNRELVDFSNDNEVKLSSLYQFLVKKFDVDKVDRTFKRYQVGTSNKWRRSTVFWQIDSNENIRSGKIMCYDSITGKRDKKKFNWHKVPDGFKMEQCLFGAHLLANFPQNCDVGIVESEKTALICDIALNGKMLWLATGGLQGLNKDKLLEFRSRNIFLFPDLSSKNTKVSAFSSWKKKGSIIGKELNIDIRVNTLLETIATETQREEQWDLADYLLS